MSPSPRTALLLALCAGVALVATPAAGALAALAVLGAALADALAVRRAPRLRRTSPPVLARGVAARLVAEAEPEVGSIRLRQPVPPDLDLDPREAPARLDATLTARRRGRHTLPPVAARREGPLGLGRRDHTVGSDETVVVFPDFPAARRLAVSVRQGRFREAGRMTRGPLGLGTDFESVRDYLPDDDIRQVNWPATQRMGRPMSNQYRVEQDREVVLLLDAGRLMTSPTGAGTRLDAAVDAAVAVGLVADAVGDRCGVVAFDREIRRRLPPRRAGGDAVMRALYDLEPRPDDADYELAFRAVEGGKRSLIVVFTDLVEEAAARPLLDAMPVLTRRHVVVVAGTSDPDLEAQAVAPGDAPTEAYAVAVALDVLTARARVAHQLRRAGAQVVEAPPGALGAACVGAYLRAKGRGRL